MRLLAVTIWLAWGVMKPMVARSSEATFTFAEARVQPRRVQSRMGWPLNLRGPELATRRPADLVAAYLTVKGLARESAALIPWRMRGRMEELRVTEAMLDICSALKGDREIFM